MKAQVDNDAEANSGPTLKRLRLRGDWSDTGPQALPEREMRNQAGGNGVMSGIILCHLLNQLLLLLFLAKKL